MRSYMYSFKFLSIVHNRFFPVDPFYDNVVLNSFLVMRSARGNRFDLQGENHETYS